MNENRLEELLSSESFLTKILPMGSAEEVQSAFKNEGVDLSIDEINKLHNTILYIAEHGELSESDLEQVAGGFYGLSMAQSDKLFAIMNKTVHVVCKVLTFFEKIDVVTLARW